MSFLQIGSFVERTSLHHLGLCVWIAILFLEESLSTMVINNDVITEQPSFAIETKPAGEVTSEERGTGGFWWCGGGEQNAGDQLLNVIDRPTAESVPVPIHEPDECPCCELCCHFCCEIGCRCCLEHCCEAACDNCDQLGPAICEGCVAGCG